MRIAIFTSRTVQKGTFVSEVVNTADKIIAADCGALSAIASGIVPEAVVGDFDSLDEKTMKDLRGKGAQFITSPNVKDETDTEIAIDYAIQHGATEIFLVGGIAGDRFEHAVANLSLTYNPKVPISIVNGPSKTWVVLGPQTVSITGKENDLLSLLPLSQIVTNIQTKGLCYPLLNEPLYFGQARGVSNVFAEKNISVSFENGLLLFIHTLPNELH
ncbi:MAG TPA: thiamine diphosphokinase [Candidatus Saccharimonadales bacterium]|nr:thiamine diphosphokinase [Candidatus Saccharimonadales bacterium]